EEHRSTARPRTLTDRALRDPPAPDVVRTSLMRRQLDQRPRARGFGSTAIEMLGDREDRRRAETFGCASSEELAASRDHRDLRPHACALDDTACAIDDRLEL